MADQTPIFELIKYGNGSVGKELWVDLGLIPTGQKIWLGYATWVAEDKDLIFCLRSNLTGLSAGDEASTQLHDYASSQGGASVDRDYCHSGYVDTMSTQGTGVEHWWLRARSVSQTSGNFDYIIYYTIY